MQKILEFPELLRLIDERSSAFRAAVAAAPSLDVPVPSCPEWTLFDLAQHIGDGRRSWAATVIAGPDATAKSASPGPAAPHEREALLAWLAVSVQELLAALREAGPDRGCWTWWETSQSPQTCGAVARHQLQEIAVHTYDAHLALGTPQPLPDEVALDGVEEFLSTCCATTSAWPHKPAAVDYHATEGRSWRLWLSPDGLRTARLPAATDGDDAATGADASVRGTAGDLVLLFYGRMPPESLELAGDRNVFDQLIAWDPDA
ncbi:maleylpyruvate isomerase family mycothiol-dependent enzyme [Actinoplanes sp. KI2]|uniref:maleylpyruvate isomerase family mycothiol-dependent enzyme n=1 Tax=Actinoplanes sp. KI2 TaxID=2983315 RepID=UPI0021D60B9B|nr:maleylpyruvate isomerase family mycothiol-dependent enzyme [Actinoplanes sp. KI2]MCU7723347.1 maleylpyruvate isomerase family mycothiol-dependent enzyme [Actinoplanes sp. KI2]